MIKVTIREAARRRKLFNAHQFGESVGFARMVASRIWKGEQLPKLRTLEKICNAWGCDSRELIVIQADLKRTAKQRSRKTDVRGTKRRAGTR